MSLPTNPKTEWPPVADRSELNQVRKLDAWYSGDWQRIRDVTTPDDLRTALRAARSNAPTTSNQLVIPLAGDIARCSADLLFSEAPKLTTDDGAAQERLDYLVDACCLDSALLEAAELCAALSGIYWRVGWDRTLVADRPIVTFVQPDGAVPEWRWGQLSAVTFWSVLPNLDGDGDKVVWRHLERHSTTTEGALIEHGLYYGTDSQLGQPMPLTEHPDTRGIAEALSDPDDGGDGRSILLPDVPRTAGYIPNMRPNRRNRRSMLGRADIDGLYGVLGAVNTTWTSWMRDLRLAKARLIVPREYTRTTGPGQGAAFDLDQELFEPLTMPAPAEAGKALTLVQFSIRVAEHEATLNRLVGQAITSAGYSLQTFGMVDEAGSGTTATEVRARERRSMVTRERKSRYWSVGLRELAYCLLAVDWYMGNPDAVEPSDVLVEFGDSVSEDPKVTAETAELLFRAQAATIETRVRMVHPDWDDERVDAEVRGIQEESGTGPMADPDPGEFDPEADPAAGGDPADELPGDAPA